jgi:cyclopropane-fatty-acyl-phospholipid synthase
VRPVDALERRLLEFIGSRVRAGSLEVVLPGGEERVFRGSRPGPSAVVLVHDLRIVRRLVTLGAIGLADGYIAGDIDSPDPAALLELGAMHLEAADEVGVPRAVEAMGRAIWRHVGRASAPRGPLTDVVQHYDLGNDFYSLWLDPSRTYSSGVFDREGMSLAEAQQGKYRLLGGAAGIQVGEHVLDIGCGWGGFAVYAAEELRCHVTAVTVSREQLDFVEKLVAERGLTDRIEPRLQDFRQIDGTFDRIVSIEMIESIPKTLWHPYFERLRRSIRPGGTIGLQAIVVADRHWRNSDANPDFIRRYIFPGGQVPAPMVLRDLARAHGLRWREDHGYGASYARTLRAWRHAFDASEQEVAALGFDEPFRRMWKYYLAYCEGGFRAGRVDVRQIVLER